MTPSPHPQNPATESPSWWHIPRPQVPQAAAALLLFAAALAGVLHYGSSKWGDLVAVLPLALAATALGALGVDKCIKYAGIPSPAYLALASGILVATASLGLAGSALYATWAGSSGRLLATLGAATALLGLGMAINNRFQVLGQGQRPLLAPALECGSLTLSALGIRQTLDVVDSEIDGAVAALTIGLAAVSFLANWAFAEARWCSEKADHSLCERLRRLWRETRDCWRAWREKRAAKKATRRQRPST